jgi:RHS repeat-associated protein
MRKKITGIVAIAILLCNLAIINRVFAQCSSSTEVIVGSITSFHLSSSEADGATNIFWTIANSSAGTIQGDRTKRDIDVLWNTATSTVVMVTYTKNGSNSKCWNVGIHQKLSPGSISTSVISIPVNEILSFSQLVSAAPASGGLFEYSGVKYRYKWQQSLDNVNWTAIDGATGLDCTGSNMMGQKTWFRREVSDGTAPVYSNVLSIDIAPAFRAGRISSSQIIAPGAVPSQLTAMVLPSGGTGTFLYQWETSRDETSWSNITAATGAAYQPGALTKTAYYRRKVVSGSQWAYTNTLQLLVQDNTSLNQPVSGSPSAVAAKESIPSYTGVTTSDLASFASYVIDKPGVIDVSQVSGLVPVKDFQKSISYLDGIGRSMQSIDYKANISGKDINTISVYNQYGSGSVLHLPYAASTDANNAGKFRTDAVTQQPQFYSSMTGNQEDYFYLLNTSESSPVSRFEKGILPGKNYAGNDIGNEQISRINYDYDNVRIWNIGSGIADVPVSNDVYAAGTLMVNVLVQEDGARVYKFFDKEGKLIMNSIQLNADKEGEGLRTYFVYDDMRNLRYVISPLAVKYCTTSNEWNFASPTAAGVLKELCSKYFYDENKQVVIKEVPGANGPWYMVYDARGRLAFIQDPAMRARGLGEWIVYFYDGLDRSVMTALYKNPAATRESLQATMNTDMPSASIVINNPPVIDLVLDESSPVKTKYEAINSITLLPGFETAIGQEYTAEINPNATGPTENYIVNSPYPAITGFEPLTVYYYDNYEWEGAKRFSTLFTVDAGTNPYASPVAPTAVANGKITGSKTKVTGKTQWSVNTVYYDVQGRVIQNLSENITGATDILTTQYDFSGKVLSTFLAHRNPRSAANPETRMQTRYEYNNGKWLAKEYHTLFNGSTAQTKLLSEWTYDEMGRPKTKTLGTLETLNYDYNLQGQLTGINAEYARDKTTNHYFGMELFYDQGFAVPRMDGNVAGVTWRKKGNPDEWHAYGYRFDNAARLTKADYVQNTSGSWTNSVVDYKVSVPAYDENGNIKQMKQDGMLLGNVKSGIDDLTYFYENNNWSNRLDGVTDPQGDKGQGDFKNYSGRTGTDDYVYDINGNLIKDRNKGITITYNNLLDKVEKISMDSDPNKNITFVYSLTGEKLQGSIKDGTKTTIYTYINGFVYKDDVLLYFQHPEGRVRRNANGQLVYDYMISDNLDNTRVVITDETSQLYYKATHEDNPQPAPPVPERDMFTFPNNVDVIPNTNKFYDYAGTNRKFIKLNSNDANRKIGTAKVLKVMAGDLVEMGVMSYYAQNAPENNTPSQPVDLIVGQLINLLLGPYSVVPNGKGNILQSSGNGLIINQEDFNTYVNNTQTNNPPSNVPKAYLNYVLFDDNFKMVTGGAIRVNQPDAVSPLASNLNINKNGYLYVYVSNESPTDVYFDDLAVKHTTGHLLQEDSYYPFGMQIRGLSSAALGRLQNNYLYNGIEKVPDFDLDIYDALYRTLDPQIGRWWQIDPATGNYPGITPYNSNFNNPVSFTDPLGNDPLGDDPPWWIRQFLEQNADVAAQIKSNYFYYFELTAPKIVNRSLGEVGQQFVTESYTLLTTLEKRRTERRLVEFKRVMMDIQKVYPGRSIPEHVDPGTIRPYTPTFTDRWSESNNVVAKSTYEISDGFWLTLQSLNPFVDPRYIAHMNGSVANNNERVGGFVNSTSQVVGYYTGGQALKVLGSSLAAAGFVGRTGGETGLAQFLNKMAGSNKAAAKFFGWGNGEAITKTLADFTKEELIANGWTKETLVKMARLYNDEIVKSQLRSAIGRSNATALVRRNWTMTIVRYFFGN